MIEMLAQQVIGPAPQAQGLSPALTFILAILGMLIPLIPALIRARSHGNVADTVIEGVETASDRLSKSPEIRAAFDKVRRGEPVTKEDFEGIGDWIKGEIQGVAIKRGVEKDLAPRVDKVTNALGDPAEIARKALAPLLLVAVLFLPGCCAVTAHDVEVLRSAIEKERKYLVVPAGLEGAVKESRDETDAQTGQMLRAHQ